MIFPHIWITSVQASYSCTERFSLVLEFVDGGEIHWRDENERPLLAENTCRAYMRDIICGLEYRLHFSFSFLYGRCSVDMY